MRPLDLLLLCLVVVFFLYLVWTVQQNNPTNTSNSRILQVPLYLHFVNHPQGLADLSEILHQVQMIWNQADVHFTDMQVNDISLSPELFHLLIQNGHQEEFQTDLDSFFEQYPMNALHVFFVDGIGPHTHGRAYYKNRLFCIISLSHYGSSLPRVISHEIGHLNSLPHPSPEEAHRYPDLLMISGHAGTRLTPQEIAQARSSILSRMS